MKENKQKYFYVRVSDEMHRQTKAKASMQGISVQEYISTLLEKDLQTEATNKQSNLWI